MPAAQQVTGQVPHTLSQQQPSGSGQHEQQDVSATPFAVASLQVLSGLYQMCRDTSCAVLQLYQVYCDINHSAELSALLSC